VDGGGSVVYLKNLFGFESGKLAEQLEGLDTVIYTSFDELVRRWRVD
jgi:hypothetical protein